MTRYLLLCAISVFIAGCAASSANLPAPRPEPAKPQQPPTPNLYISAPSLPGWVQAPAPEGMGDLALVNEELGVQFTVGVFMIRKDAPRDMVGWFMIRMMAQGAEIGDMGLPHESAGPASVEFTATATNGVGITGMAAAKVSGIDGLGLMMIGMWPTANDAAARRSFGPIFSQIDILRQ